MNTFRKILPVAKPPARTSPLSARPSSAPQAIQAFLNPAQVQNLYGLNKPFGIPEPTVNEIFEIQHEKIKEWIGHPRDLLKMLDLKNYLKGEPGREEDRYMNLLRFNSLLSAKEVFLGKDKKHFLSADTGAQLLRVIRGALLSSKSGRIQEVLREIYAKRGMGEIIDIFNTSSDFTLLDVTETIREHGGNLQHLGLTELRILNDLLLAAPPGPPRRGMGGGMDWGRGELSNVPENQLVHFLKHCLRLKQQPPGYAVQGGNPDQHEPWKWMARLHYKIQKAYVTAYADSAVIDFAQDLARVFPFTSTSIATCDQADAFFRILLPKQPQLVARLCADYMPRYLSHVRDSTRALMSPFVIVNNRKVQLVGLTRDDQFIVGKWDPDARRFTISSSYVTLEKIQENLPFKVWSL